VYESSWRITALNPKTPDSPPEVEPMRPEKREESLGANVFPRHCVQVEILRPNPETTGFTLWRPSLRVRAEETPFEDDLRRRI
jgi:hypothetical protein